MERVTPTTGQDHWLVRIDHVRAWLARLVTAAMVAALAVASRHGILIKSARFLEALSEARRLVLDKTGTVTIGRLDVARVVPVNGCDESELLRCATYCAQGSKHPASQAVVREADARGLPRCAPVNLVEQPGRGVEATLGESALRLGSAAWLDVLLDNVHALDHHPIPLDQVDADRALLSLVPAGGDQHRIALGGSEIGQNASRRRLDLHVGLVGGDLDDGLALGHRITGPLEPAHDAALARVCGGP